MTLQREVALDRVYKHANMILHRGLTIREVAKETNWSKSTVHKDIHDRLKQYDRPMYDIVCDRLAVNMKLGYIKGGEVNKQNWAKRRSEGK